MSGSVGFGLSSRLTHTHTTYTHSWSQTHKDFGTIYPCILPVRHSVRAMSKSFADFVSFPAPAMDVPDSDAVNAVPHVADMKDCEERLKTYGEWPKYLRPSPSDLAMAGFYYTGMGDRVMCFNCKVILKNWKPSDSAWGEHAKWRPSCDYVKMVYCKPKHSFTIHGGGYDVCDGPVTKDTSALSSGSAGF